MPHISTERVKEIRTALKKKYPFVKFSVTRRHFSTVKIVVLESPYSWSKDRQSINHFYPQNHENSDFLRGIIEIANEGNKTEYYDGDYGNIPTFYLDIEIGQWDKPHKTIPWIGIKK